MAPPLAIPNRTAASLSYNLLHVFSATALIALCILVMFASPSHQLLDGDGSLHGQIGRMLKTHQEAIFIQTRRAIGSAVRRLGNGSTVSTLEKELLKSIASVEQEHALSLPESPSMWASYSYFELLLKIFAAQMCFMTILYLIENVRDLFFPNPRRLKLDADYLNGNPRKATIQEALHYDTPMTRYDTLKLYFFAVTGILFWRVFFFVTCVLSAMLMVNVCSLNGRTRYTHPRWFGFFYQMAVFYAHLALAAIGIYNVRVYGSRADPKDARLLVGNHSCVVEAMVVYGLAVFPSFVSRAENLSVPLFSGIARACDAIIVDRKVMTSNIHTTQLIVDRARDRSAPQVVIFPEGTTTNQHTLFLFKRGAFDAGVPLQMVCCSFPYTYFNPSWSGRICGGNDATDLLIRLTSQFVNRSEIAFLPLYSPTEEEQNDPTLFADHCQRMMATVLQASISDATYKSYLQIKQTDTQPSGVNGESSSSSQSSLPVTKEENAAGSANSSRLSQKKRG